MQNESISINELVNKYYYDIESSKVYFKTLKFWKMNSEQRFTYFSIIIYFLLIFLSILIIILHSFGSAFTNFNFEPIFPMPAIWLLYIISLIVYGYIVIKIDKRKDESLKFNYQAESILEIQKKWLDVHIPNNINKMKLIKETHVWLQNHDFIKNFYNNFTQTGRILQTPVLNTAFKATIPLIILAISTIVLGDLSLQEIVKKNPTSVLSLIVYVIALIVILASFYNPIKIAFYRLFAHMDGEKSTSIYRFNIFNRMLLNHVTVKDLNDV